MTAHKPDTQVTVVIPLYNKRDVVGRAITSVIQQTVPDWELLIVDDGSTDGSYEVAEAHTIADTRIRVHRQPNMGPGAARNRGLSLAQTPWIAFLDADDEWCPQFLEHCLRTAAIMDASAVATAWTRDSKSPCSISAKGSTVYMHGLERRLAMHVKRDIDRLHSSAVLARTELIAECGGYFDRDHCTYGEDSWLWIQVLSRGRVVRTDTPLIRFHTDASSLSVGRISPYPVPPLLSHAREALDALPSRYQHRGTRYLLWYACWIAARMGFETGAEAARQTMSSIARDQPVLGACISSIRHAASLGDLLRRLPLIGRVIHKRRRWHLPGPGQESC